ncbi:MAG: HAD-IA family hydrolase [Sphaerochaetaceae bacterium]|nr:HAD-IA family hydrolase [Spirochaetales bacterium]MDY5499012.1 HAD-IA family hydrolase [Sphaerochaetaceae bacterium]
MLRMLISDIGDVLLVWQGVMRDFCRAHQIDKQAFSEWYRHDYSERLYKGEIVIRDFWDAVERRWHVQTKGDPFSDAFQGRTIAAVKSLYLELKRKGIRLVSASNTYREDWEADWRSGDMGIFDAHYPSHLLGLCKPHVEYFQTILEREHAKAEDCLFIDDRLENIEGARKAGIPAYRYTYAEDPHAKNLKSYIAQLQT